MALFFGVALLYASYYGLSNNSYYVQLLISLDLVFVYARVALLSVLSLYIFLPRLRTYTTRSVLCIAGVMSTALGFMSVFWPVEIVASTGNVLLGDSLSLIVAGILTIVLGNGLSARRSSYVSAGIHYVRSMWATTHPEIVAHAEVQTKRKASATEALLKAAPLKS